MLCLIIKWSLCQYCIRISRITNVFVRRDRGVTHEETNSKVGSGTGRALSQTSFRSIVPAGRVSRKDLIEHHKEIQSGRDLFEVIKKLCTGTNKTSLEQ